MASTALNEMGFRPDVIERQLAHEEKNAAEYWIERRTMMSQWADYIDATVGQNVVSLHSQTNRPRRPAFAKRINRARPGDAVLEGLTKRLLAN